MFEEDLMYLYREKEKLGYTWGDIARILNEKNHTNYSGDAYRKRFSRLRKRDTDNYQYSFDYDDEEKSINLPKADSIIGSFNIEEEFNTKKEIQRLRDERA